jgi:phosphoserine phosphatase
MDFVLTLIASDKPLGTAHLAGITRYLDSQGIALAGDPRWLKQHKAADLYTVQRPNSVQLKAMREALVTDRIDIMVNRTEGRKKKLLLSDMDATILANETLDDISDVIGLGEECRIITEKAMRGEIDLITSIRERVALLKGLRETVLADILSKVTYNEGAELLVRGMAQQGAVCVLVSSGFTFFTSAVARDTGFMHHHGNTLEIRDGILTGQVTDPVLDKHSKLEFLNHYADELGLDESEIMAIGDGANDLLMLQAAGLGVGYRPKPILAESLDNLLLYGDLSAALYAQGLVPNIH